MTGSYTDSVTGSGCTYLYSAYQPHRHPDCSEERDVNSLGLCKFHHSQLLGRIKNMLIQRGHLVEETGNAYR